MNKISIRFLIAAIVTVLVPTFAFAADESPIETLIKAKKYEEARPLIEERLQQTPEDEYLIYNLALVHYAEGDYEEAVVLWEKVRMANDPDLVTKAMAQIGNASYRISVAIAAENRPEDSIIQLRRAQRSLEAAVERDDDYEMASKNYSFVSEQLVNRLIVQGNAKIERSDTKWIKGERDLVLFRSALTDYEEALSIKPEDESIQKLVEETRQRMTDYLTESGKDNLKDAEKLISKVPEDKEKPLNRDENRDLQVAKDTIEEAVANFEDAASISPDNEKAKQAAQDARKQASKLMQDIAERQRAEGAKFEEMAADARQKLDDVRAQIKDDSTSKKEQSKLQKEASELAKQLRSDDAEASRALDKALENFEAALSLDPDNAGAAAGKEELEKKLSKQHEDKADEQLETADAGQERIDQWEPLMQDYQEQIANATNDKAKQDAQSRLDKLEEGSAQTAQAVADRLMTAKTELEAATQLDATNQSAAKKLEETYDKLATAMEQAGDKQLAAAEQLMQKGEEDQSIARMEQAIKDFDAALALSDSSQQQQAVGQKLEAAQQELLSQRGERAKQQAAAQQEAMQQQQMQAANQPTPPSQPTGEGQQETAMEYQEMVQFTENPGSEQFGKFDTKAMKKAVKDW